MAGKQAEKFMQALQSPKVKQKRTRNSNDPLTKAEVQKLIEGTTKLEDRVLFVLGFNTGMRVSEIVNIPWIAVDYVEQKIEIWDEKKDRYRKVRPNRYTLSILKLWHGENIKDKMVFSFSKKTVQRKLQYWTQKILGKKKSWHCIRHTYITLNIIAGTPVTIVCDNTGDSPATIYQYYTQIPPQKMQEYIEAGAVYSEG